MNISAISCPSCGASLDMDLQDREFVFCPYCGQQIAITDENKKRIQITSHVVDEADIIRAKNEGNLTPAQERIEKARLKHQARIAEIEAKERTKIALAQVEAEKQRSSNVTNHQPSNEKQGRGCCGSGSRREFSRP